MGVQRHSLPFPGIPSGSVWCVDRSGPFRTWKMCPFHLSITVRVWSADVLPLSVTIWLKFVEVPRKKVSQRVQKRKRKRRVGPAAGAVSKPGQTLKDEIHFVSSSAPSSPDEGSGGEEGEGESWREREAVIEKEICLICQKFFNLIYSCQDAEDPDLITAFYLPDLTPGARHSSLTLTHTHTQTRARSHTHAETTVSEWERDERGWKLFTITITITIHL